MFKFWIAIITLYSFYSVLPSFSMSLPLKINNQDTLKENQVLYIGKMWSDPYPMIKGDQFLFSREFLPGTLTLNGNSYKNLLINYDIYNDEILVPKNKSSIVQLNKEMVDSFSVYYAGLKYKFVNTKADSLSGIKGFANEIYRGKTVLYVKYKKEIEELAVDDKYDLFYLTYRIYLLKGGQIYPITNKGDLIKILNAEKTRIRDFLKKNRLKVSKKEPGSFIPVIRYYDSISQ
jgi:hypothetical protein